MRPAAVTLTLLLACTSSAPPAGEVAPTASAPATSRTVAVPGLTLEVPATWVEEGPALLASARGRLAAEAPPGSRLEVAVVHHPDGVRAGMLYLQAMETPRDDFARPRTVRQALARLRVDMETRIVADGGELVRADVAERDAGIEGCYTARALAGGRWLEARLCMRGVYTSPERVAMAQVLCMAEDQHIEASCGKILEGRRFDLRGIDPATVLAPNLAPPVPLAGVGRDRVAGVVFGASRDEFAAACTGAGFAVDAVDWAKEPAYARTWFAEGRMARCEGLPGAGFDLARVTRVVAVFVEGRLAVATLELDAPRAAVEPRLLAAYPEFVFSPARQIHTIDEEARGDDLLRVGLDEPRTGGCALHFASERGAHAPAIAVPQGG